MKHFQPCQLLFAILGLIMGLTAGSQAQTNPPLWSSSASYAAGDQVQMNGNIYRAISTISPSATSPVANYQQWELFYVRANTTLIIGKGQNFPTLHAAWVFLENARVAETASVKLYISAAKGNYSELATSNFNLNHPFGSQISIMGDGTAVMIAFPSTGFTIDSNHAFGSISNMNISYFGQGLGEYGIFASSNGNIAELSNLVLNGFTDGIYAVGGGQVFSNNSLTFDGVKNLVVASLNATVTISGGLAVGTARYSKGVTTCIFNASNGAQIQAQGSSLFNASGSVAYAISGGVIDLDDSIIGYSLYGVEAYKGGRIIAAGCKFENNGVDIIALQGGTVDASGASYANYELGPNDGSYIW